MRGVATTAIFTLANMKADECAQEILNGKIAALAGPNFSGRTDFLRAVTGLELARPIARMAGQKSDEIGVYIYPEVYNCLSGIAPTVGEEIRLNCRTRQKEIQLRPLVESLGLTRLLDRNPFTLSGGEQSLLVAVCALAANPRIVAADCSLEQVDWNGKQILFDWHKSSCSKYTSLVLADNRLHEYRELPRILQREDYNPVDPAREAPQISGQLRSAIEAADFEPCYITINNLTFSYPTGMLRRHKTPVLKSISVCLEPGQVYVLEGENGAGKSTLAKILCGVLRPDSGRVFVNGTETRLWRKGSRIVGYHFQNPDIQLFSTTVLEEVQAGFKEITGNSHDCVEVTRGVINIFGLTSCHGEHPLDLPFVLRKRVALAATIVMNSPWLILDEPTLGQDDAMAEVIATIIETLAKLGKGIIVISHSEMLSRRLRAQRFELKDGVLVRHGS
jgi:energy-coupling factor transporter ATP-binding protein EcfA2